jgi:hypothetical protein
VFRGRGAALDALLVFSLFLVLFVLILNRSLAAEIAAATVAVVGGELSMDRDRRVVIAGLAKETGQVIG